MMDARVAQWRQLLMDVFTDRLVVVAGGVAAGASARIAALRAFGVERCLVLASGRGTGLLPDADDAEIVIEELPAAADVPASIRAEEELFAHPPATFLAALDSFDPDRRALVLPPPFAALREVAGRPVYGGRHPAWVALEDKTTTDELLAAAGIATPPYEIVASNRRAVTAAARRLDRGAGTVWSGDASQGFNGSGAYVRWVRGARDADEAIAHLGAKCARLRIASFVEGIPCSVHGFVTTKGVAAFRPVELLTLRSDRTPRLRFAGAGTYWDPPDDDRHAMRRAAGRLGEVLRDRVDFRGAFTIDGVLGAHGWVATECNPRFGAGLAYARVALPGVPLDLLHHVVVAGDGDVVQAVDLEDIVIAGADSHRWGATWTPVPVRWSASTSLPLTGDASGFDAAPPDAPADASLTFGPGPTGGFVRCEFVAGRTPSGPSLAPRAVAALAFADAYAHSGIGRLRAAATVR